MTIETVAEFCDKHGACADGREWAVANCSSMADVYDKCPRGDWLIWAIRRSGAEIDKAIWVRLAVTFARRTLPIFERKHPTDKRPQKAIEASEAWLANPCNDTRSAAYAAAYAAYAVSAAYAAAYAVSAAYAAAYAASAACADYAAAYAASAAVAAASAAAAAASDADAYAAAAATRSTERKWQADEIRKAIPNPWRTR